VSLAAPLVRRPDWPTRLDRFLQERRARPLQWGSHDCCLFALDWIEEATGRRLAEVRGSYQDAEGAAALLRQRWGTGDLAALATVMLGRTSRARARDPKSQLQEKCHVWSSFQNSDTDPETQPIHPPESVPFRTPADLPGW